MNPRGPACHCGISQVPKVTLACRSFAATTLVEIFAPRDVETWTRMIGWDSEFFLQTLYGNKFQARELMKNQRSCKQRMNVCETLEIRVPAITSANFLLYSRSGSSRNT